MDWDVNRQDPHQLAKNGIFTMAGYLISKNGIN